MTDKDTIELTKDTFTEVVKEFERLSQPPNEETRDFYENEKWKYRERLPEGAKIIVKENNK